MGKQVATIFKTSGNILEIGSFIAASGNKIDITEEDIDEIYANLNENESVPFAIGHGKTAEIIGKAVEFSKNGSIIEHKGIVTESDKFKQYIMGRNISISPEIQFIKDNRSGKIVGKKISKLCFVSNPAIKNNETEITTFKFSAPELTEIESEVMTEEKESTKTENNESQFDFAKLAEAITEGVSKKFENQINSLALELEKLKSEGRKANAIEELMQEDSDVTEKPLVESKSGETTLLTAEPFKPPKQISKEVFDEYTKAQAELAKRNEEVEKLKKISDEVLNDKLNGLVADLKKFKVEKPDEMLKSLPINERIKALEEIKAQIMKTSSMTSPTDIEMESEGGTKKGRKPQKTYLEFCKETNFPIDLATESGINKIKQRSRELGIPSGLIE